MLGEGYLVAAAAVGGQMGYAKSQTAVTVCETRQQHVAAGVPLAEH